LCVAVTVIAKFRRGCGRGCGRVGSGAMFAPHRRAWVAMASGDDEDGQAKAALRAVPARIWTRLRPSVVAFLAKLGGVPADSLGELMRLHGEVDRARRMLTSRSAVGPARAAYLPGLVRDPSGVALVLPL